MSRRGFALVAVLWTVALLGGVVGLGVAGTRLGQRTTVNRIVMTRGRWAAEACLAIAEARATRDALKDTATIDLGRSVTCRWTIEHPDALLDLNAAPAAVLVRLATMVGLTHDSAQLFAEAMVTQRRRGGFTDVRQIESLPGAKRILHYLTVDGSGRVDLSTAGTAVLAALPGMTPEAVELLVRRREIGVSVRGVDELSGALSPAGRAALLAEYADLAPIVTFESHRLVLTAEGWVGSYGRYPATTVEIVVERVSDRLAVLQRRIR